MLLPLAWLIRVDDRPEYREWLKQIATDIEKCQDESGAIREELGHLIMAIWLLRYPMQHMAQVKLP